MTWNDLIHLLHQIPEHRREEKAIFVDLGESGQEWEIDALAVNDGEPIQIVDLNLKDTDNAYFLTP